MIVILPRGLNCLNVQHLKSLPISVSLLSKLVSIFAKSESKSIPKSLNLFVQISFKSSQIWLFENLFLPIQIALHLVKLILSPDICLNLSNISIIFSRLVSEPSRQAVRSSAQKSSLCSQFPILKPLTLLSPLILSANISTHIINGSLYLPAPLIQLRETFCELPLSIYCPSPLKIKVDGYRVNGIFPPKINS